MLMDLFKRKKPESEYLVFDNIPFKLAIIQSIMYDSNLMGEIYDGKGEFRRQYRNRDAYGEMEEVERLRPYIKKGYTYFSELRIPSRLAVNVRELNIGESSEIYHQINPKWPDLEDYLHTERLFDITDISEREVRQFPNLRSITFDMYNTPPDRIVSKLLSWGIGVDIN